MGLNEAAAALWAPVPEPPVPEAKPAKSYRQLRPNQYLSSLDTILLGRRSYPKGTLFQVTSVDSLSAELVLVANPTERLLWTRPEWKDHFERARRPKKATTKKPTKET